jgi:hypothetical protein
LAGGSGTTGGTGAGWRPAAAPLDVSGPPVATLEVEGAQVVLCASEEELITRWVTGPGSGQALTVRGLTVRGLIVRGLSGSEAAQVQHLWWCAMACRAIAGL